MRALLSLVLLTLAACDGGQADADRVATAKSERRAARSEAAEARLAKPPVPRTYSYPDGDLRVLEVPVKDGSGFVDVQRCFVWRDHEYRTATLSCGQMPDLHLPN